MNINPDLLQWFISMSIKKLLVESVKNEIICNKKLAEQLYNPFILKLEKRKVNSPFMNNIWGRNLEDMQMISKFNKGFRFLLCVIDIYNKYKFIIKNWIIKT